MTKTYWQVSHDQLGADEPLNIHFRTESAAEAFVLEHVSAGGSATTPVEVTLCTDKDRREIARIEMEIMKREHKFNIRDTGT